MGDLFGFGISEKSVLIGFVDREKSRNALEDLREKIFSPPNTLLSAKNNIMIQGILQSIIAEKESTKYFLTLDNIIRNVRKRLYTNIKKVSI